MADDGVGPRVIQQLEELDCFPPAVRFLDGGTLGLDLLPYLEGIDNLLIIDALETGGPPGTLQRLAGADVPAAFTTKLSPHQMGLQDLLAVANLLGHVPRNIVLWGVQPASIEPEMNLTSAVAAQLEVLVGKVLDELEQWSVGRI